MSGGFSTPTRHPIYYFTSASHVFQVDNILYRLCDSVLSSFSQTFHDMFHAAATAGHEGLDGQSDEKPIHLDGVTREIFELFLEHAFNSCRTRASGQYTIEELSNTFATSQHRVLGTAVFTSLIYMQAASEQHRRIVATEVPKILMHTSDCQEPVGCNEDWHAIWWNGMGRFLLDGRNPQPYREAVKRFKVMQFGRVGRGCKELMFKILERGAAFHYADQFIEHACNRLVEQLISDSSTST
ncbi:hypothetical protein K503DRAFT_857339 [Rhizopogon vinicolor AM-OR11-026]|uniref:BTB domain-containing protein n=1 Tax=Rhizopogon vinicolor AM-OR11-026 TaxID=1314800 RepID=A0A1B7MXY6_9AGAM|nr:hypothetical protein K503DRAFT_857339 [Rhizopogon vinicolor AM-OR11-026]